MAGTPPVMYDAKKKRGGGAGETGWEGDDQSHDWELDGVVQCSQHY